MTRHSVNNNTCMSLAINIFSFKFKSFDQFNTPPVASNFRHVLSCGTVVPFGFGQGHLDQIM